MAKLQRRFVVGSTYKVQGSSKFSRTLRFVARIKLDGKELLLFRPAKKISKFRNE